MLIAPAGGSRSSSSSCSRFRLGERLTDDVHYSADSLLHPPRRRCPVATGHREDAASSNDARPDSESRIHLGQSYAGEECDHHRKARRNRDDSERAASVDANGHGRPILRGPCRDAHRFELASVMPGHAHRTGMSYILATGLTRADTNGRQKLSGCALVERNRKASVVVGPQRSTDQSFEGRFGGLNGQHPHRPLDESGIKTGLGRSRLHLAQRQPT